MSDWTPEVVKIEKVEKHPFADTLSIYTVLNDYPVIDKTDKYNVGDLVAYIPIDTIVPDTEEYYFLCPLNREQYEENGEIKNRIIGPKYSIGSVPEKYRTIKAKRIRDIYSQGMLVSAPQGLEIGASVVDILNLKKAEEENEDNLPQIKLRGRNALSPPKGWAIPYYDIDGLRKYVSCLKEDEEVVLTEKLNGSNFSACFDGEQLWVKSRNFYKRKEETDPWWDAAIRLDLENKLKNYPMLVFFGELVGNVKKYRYGCGVANGKLMTTVYFFDVYDIKKGRYLDYDDRVALITGLGLSPVPELYKGLWLGKEEMYKFAEGKSNLGNHIREGFVLNTRKERYEERMQSRMQIKLIGEGHNLQK